MLQEEARAGLEDLNEQKETLREDSEQIAKEIQELEEHCHWNGRPTLSESLTGTDNLFRSYKKNLLKTLDHIELWDSNYIPTEIGTKFIEIGDFYGPESEEMLKFFGKLFLEHGNHFDLILDLEEYIPLRE